MFSMRSLGYISPPLRRFPAIGTTVFAAAGRTPGSNRRISRRHLPSQHLTKKQEKGCEVVANQRFGMVPSVPSYLDPPRSTVGNMWKTYFWQSFCGSNPYVFSICTLGGCVLSWGHLVVCPHSGHRFSTRTRRSGAGWTGWTGWIGGTVAVDNQFTFFLQFLYWQYSIVTFIVITLK